MSVGLIVSRAIGALLFSRLILTSEGTDGNRPSKDWARTWIVLIAATFIGSAAAYVFEVSIYLFSHHMW